jgi:hypothetical protein
MKTDFNPVYPVYYEVFTSEQEKAFSKVFYFGNGTEVEEAKGKITGLEKNESAEEYLIFDSGQQVRIDRIITVNGIPGPAYDEYDAFALACLNCNVGME